MSRMQQVEAAVGSYDYFPLLSEGITQLFQIVDITDYHLRYCAAAKSEGNVWSASG